jgi:predicted ATP-dependent endonuclease of OLD family
MSTKYQTVSSTHSPFVISEKLLPGYRRIARSGKEGTKCSSPAGKEADLKKDDYKHVRSCLTRSSNLISLFADSVVIVEGAEDRGFYHSAAKFIIPANTRYTAFVPSNAGGVSNLHVSLQFFKLLGLDKVSIVVDLDALFDKTFEPTLQAVGSDPSIVDGLRKAIGYSDTGQPGLAFVLQNIGKVDSKLINKVIGELREKSVFVLSKGSPENYYAETLKTKHAGRDSKTLWQFVESKADFVDVSELELVLKAVSE